MSRAVLDSSALLALLFNEAGAQTVIGHLPGSLMSAVNLAEVITKTVESGMTLEQSQRLLADFPSEIVDFDNNQAYLTASLQVQTRQHGLSLGDRACLALGLKTRYPILTADQKWDACGIDVKLIQIR